MFGCLIFIYLAELGLSCSMQDLLVSAIQALSCSMWDLAPLALALLHWDHGVLATGHHWGTSWTGHIFEANFKNPVLIYLSNKGTIEEEIPCS